LYIGCQRRWEVVRENAGTSMLGNSHLEFYPTLPQKSLTEFVRIQLQVDDFDDADLENDLGTLGTWGSETVQGESCQTPSLEAKQNGVHLCVHSPAKFVMSA
jgi:hypothetical protein